MRMARVIRMFKASSPGVRNNLHLLAGNEVIRNRGAGIETG